VQLKRLRVRRSLQTPMRPQPLARVRRPIQLRRTEQFREPFRRGPLRVRQARLQQVGREASRRIQRPPLQTIQLRAMPAQIRHPTPGAALPLHRAGRRRLRTLQMEPRAKPLHPSRKHRRRRRCNCVRNIWMRASTTTEARSTGFCSVGKATYASLPHSRNQQAALTTHLNCGHRYTCGPRRFIRLNSEVIP
jgi:hypothetical protein